MDHSKARNPGEIHGIPLYLKISAYFMVSPPLKSGNLGFSRGQEFFPIQTSETADGGSTQMHRYK